MVLFHRPERDRETFICNRTESVYFEPAFVLLYSLQALEVIKKLKETMEIERAQMRLRLFIPSKEAKRVHDKLKANISIVESEDWQGGDLEMVLIF